VDLQRTRGEWHTAYQPIMDASASWVCAVPVTRTCPPDKPRCAAADLGYCWLDPRAAYYAMTLPFDMPDEDVFFASPKRVLAHYFPSFPLSIGNSPPASDYYQTQFLSIDGEGGQHAAYGGYLRARPLGLTPDPNMAGYVLDNRQKEVRMAIARGITGFSFDILGLNVMSPTGNMTSLLAAAQAVDPRFWVMPMLDMSALVGLTQAQAVALIVSFSDPVKYPNISRLADGRLLFSAFNATVQSLGWWQSVISALNIQNVDVAFIPILLGEPASNSLAAISHGFGGWGTATPAAAASCPPSMMMPVLPQQFRPKDTIFWEAQNTGAFRAGWLAAINGGAEYVQIVTWSDFSETGQVQPYTDASLSTNIGTGFYDLTAYYATWFVTGTQPVITRDVLYWSYRKLKSTDPHPKQPDAFTVVGPIETSNIEVLAFLTAPGTVVINDGATQCPAGITSVKVPTATGNPTFALQRDGSNVSQFTGPVTIGPNAQGTTDLTYWGGSFP
jgi:Glycosyl hydrolase family 71